MHVEILTPAEAASILQISHGMALQLLNEGKLPGRRVGKRWRLDAAALERFIKTGAVATKKRR